MAKSKLIRVSENEEEFLRNMRNFDIRVDVLILIENELNKWSDVLSVSKNDEDKYYTAQNNYHKYSTLKQLFMGW